MQYTYRHSVIIPVYNRYQGLERAINSIKSPGYKIQVIVVDDGSTVNYDQIIKKAYNNIDILYIKIANSGGPSLPRNIGISYSQGEWISFLDSDDYFHINKFSSIDKFTNGEINLIHHKAKSFGQSDKVIGLRPIINLQFHLWKISNPIVLSSVSLKNEFVQRNGIAFDPRLNSIEDYDLWLRLTLMEGFKSHYVNKELVFYQVENNSISKISTKVLLKYFKLLRKFNNTNQYILINVNLKLVIASILIQLNKVSFARKIIDGINFASNIYLIPKALYLYSKL